MRNSWFLFIRISSLEAFVFYISNSFLPLIPNWRWKLRFLHNNCFKNSQVSLSANHSNYVLISQTIGSLSLLFQCISSQGMTNFIVLNVVKIFYKSYFSFFCGRKKEKKDEKNENTKKFSFIHKSNIWRTAMSI